MVFSAPTLVKFIAAESRTLMDKCRPSRRQHYWLFRRCYRLVPLLITLTIPLWPHITCAITFSHDDVQTECLIARLEGALPKMLAEAAPADRANVQQQFERLATTPQGCYALVDYVNFKGEGVLRTERYQGQGWGLLQVLESMHGTSDTTAVDEFSGAAKAILTRRVHNAPVARHESRWLAGWIRRVSSYSGR